MSELGKLARAKIIIREILERHAISHYEMRSHICLRSLVDAREEVAIGLRGIGLSFPEIGRLMNRDHSTVMHLCDRKRRNEKRRKVA